MGFLGRGLVARHGLVKGVLLASVFFGLAHLDPVHAAATAIIGLGIHVVYLGSKSILAPMLLHTLNNALAFAIAKLIVPQMNVPLDALDHHFPVVTLVSLAVVVIIGWLFYETRVRWILPDGGVWSPGYATAEMPPATPWSAWPTLRTTALALAAYLAFIAAVVWEVISMG